MPSLTGRQKIGLKLWSTNPEYIPLARELFARGVFDYIELFTAPGSLGAILRWKALDIPFILHAPHSGAGLNPADAGLRASNIELVRQVAEFFDALSPVFVIFHPGMNGELKEAVAQLKFFEGLFPVMYRKVIIENKPLIGLGGEHCLGASPEEMKTILDGTGRGFCLDLGHAICYSVAVREDWKSVVSVFLTMKPAMFHLSDGFFSGKDSHEHLGAGEFDLSYFAGLIGGDVRVTLETKKDSPDSLDDFVRDVETWRSYAGV